MRTLCTALLLALSFAALAEENTVILNAQALARASQASVEQALGKPEFCRKAKLGLSCRYAAHGTEVVYANDQAQRITINDLDELTFDKGAIARLGFAVQEPAEISDEVLRWQDVSGVSEITLFPNKDKTDYAVIVVTPPGDSKAAKAQ